MKLDPLVSLAFAVQANPGVYALLLGSGTSRSAGIPTGWEVVVDMTRRLARLHGEDPEPDPESWYVGKFGEEPSYDALLAALGRTPAERRGILESYFQPSEEDVAEGRRVPQEAHHAIARLVRSGHIKVVLTTNFDRLIETALREHGVEPVIISSESGFLGARPLVHSDPVVVKLHGDYRDDRIRNTPAELAEYGPAATAFLRRILDEFGLIICGWSAEYDVALREALLACPARRYSAYWTAVGAPGDQAERLVRSRDAVVIDIASADSFFGQLADKVEAIDASDSPHPLSIGAAVAATKRLLSSPDGRIRLEDLLAQEVEKVKARTEDGDFSVRPSEYPGEYRRRLALYESVTETLCHVLAAIAWYDGGSHGYLVTRALNRLAETTDVSGAIDRFLEEMRLFPAFRAQYAVGIAALASGHMTYLSAALVAPVVTGHEQDIPLVAFATIASILSRDRLRRVDEGYGKRHTPGSEYMHRSLRRALQQCLPSDNGYDRAFDLFEYVAGLVYWDLTGRERAPVGRFGWRRESQKVINDFVSQLHREGSSSPLLSSGMFDGRTERLLQAVDGYRDFVSKVAAGW